MSPILITKPYVAFLSKGPYVQKILRNYNSGNVSGVWSSNILTLPRPDSATRLIYPEDYDRNLRRNVGTALIHDAAEHRKSKLHILKIYPKAK
jgi:hypothetical protein